MKKFIYLFLIIGVFGLSACSEEGKQEAKEDIGKTKELEKAEQVQETVDEKAAEDKKSTESTEETEKEGNE
jgi:hypothetical protein